MARYVHRRADGSIAMTMNDILPGYSLTPTGQELLVETVADNDPELLAQRYPANPRDGEIALLSRRIRELERSPVLANQVAALRLRIERLGG